MVAKTTDETLLATLAAIEEAGGVRAAARLLGIDHTTVLKHKEHAAKRGLLGYGPVLPGFEVSRTTTVRGPGGETQREFITQRPERDEEDFVMPEGMTLDRATYQVANGKLERAWLKPKTEGPTLESKIAVIERAFENFKPMSPYVTRPADCDRDRLTAYIFCDWHLGLFAHGKETGGPDWDLSIAKKVLSECVAEIVDQSPRSENAVLLGLGDLLHADNSRNMTERSGNVLDVDTRYSKVLETCCDLMAEASERIALRHAKVELTFKPGNHDPESTVGIRQALRMYHRNSKSVVVDTSPNPFYWRRFGVNLIGGAHGDKAKIPDFPLIMAKVRRKDWGETTTQHFHTGHIHHDSEKEIGGVHVYSHRAPVAQDAFHSAHGYLSGRSMKSYNYHVEKGSRGHVEVEIQ